jgi:hypothetical protein
MTSRFVKALLRNLLLLVLLVAGFAIALKLAYWLFGAYWLPVVAGMVLVVFWLGWSWFEAKEEFR